MALRDIVYRMHIAFTFRQTQAELMRVQRQFLASRLAMEAFSKTMLFSIGHIAAVGGAFFAMTMVLKDYEDALVRAGAIGGMTATETALLGQKINKTAAMFGASVQGMSEGVLELTKAGFDFADVMDVMDTITKVNIANNLDFAASAEIAVLVMKAFKIPVDKLEDHFDELQYVVHKTLMDMGDFIELLRYAGSSAIVTNVSTRQLYAMAGALADVAQQSGIGARGVNRLMNEMLKEVDQVQNWADTLGIGVEVIKDGALNIDGLIRGFHELGMDIDIAQQSMQQFSIRSARAWLGLLVNAEEYFELLEGQKDAAGYLDSVVGPQLETIANRLTRMKNELMGAFRDQTFLRLTKEGFDALHEGVRELIPPLKIMMLELIAQAPSMFEMLFNSVQALLPILTGGLLPVFQTMSKVLEVLAGGNGHLIRIIVLFFMFKKMVPLFSLSFNALTAAVWGTANATLMLKQAISGFVTGLILLWGLKDSVKWAMYGIAASIMAVAIAIVAAKTALGDWTSAVKVGLVVGGLVASSAAMLAMLQATAPPGDKYDKSYVSESMAESSEMLGGMATGTKYVPRTGRYLLHEGEPVGTATEGLFARGGGGNLTFINRGTLVGSEEALRDIIRRIMREEAEEEYG